MIKKLRGFWQELKTPYSLPPLGLLTPEAANRAIAGLAPEVIQLALDEIRVTHTADVIRKLFEKPFAEEDIDFPPIHTQAYGDRGQTIVRQDPLRTGIVLWERETGVPIEEAVIDREAIEKIVAHVPITQTVQLVLEGV